MCKQFFILGLAVTRDILFTHPCQSLTQISEGREGNLTICLEKRTIFGEQQWWLHYIYTHTHTPTHVCAVRSHSVVSSSFQPHGLYARLLCPWGFSRQEYWSGLPSPPAGDLPNQESNLGLPYCRRILYYLSHQGRPYIYIYTHTHIHTYIYIVVV